MSMLIDTLGYLRQLQADGVTPPAAVAGIACLSERHPDTPVDLVWLEEPYDRSVHYDALIHLPGEGTVSLSFARNQDLPWPLRGVQRWRDRDLARVNDVVLTVDQAITQLDFVWDQAPIVRRLVDACLIQETLQREPIDVDEVDLQEAMDAFRRARRLFGAEDTHRWLADQGLSSDKLEQLLTDQATLRKLRERVAGGQVDTYFQQHREEFAEVALLRLDFADQQRASAAVETARGGTAFETLARHAIAEAFASGQPAPQLESVVLRRRDADKLELLPTAEPRAPSDSLGAAFAASLVDADADAERCAALSGNEADPGAALGAARPRREGDPGAALGAARPRREGDLVAALFAARPGEVLGPVRSDRGAALLQVLGVRPARLDSRTRAAIVHALFEAWLAERRRTARIEWYWGNATQVAQV
jgi:putative peptide maturation system protein